MHMERRPFKYNGHDIKKAWSYHGGALKIPGCPHMVDDLREMRTMVVMSLPYPPLPVRVESRDPLELSAPGEDRTTTTHTLISRCLNEAVERNDAAANGRREKAQMFVFQKFMHALGCGGFDMKPRALFELYCRYAREHIETYFEGPKPPIEFAELDSIKIGDGVHRKMCEWMAAQSILFQEKPARDRKYYETKSYGSLLLMARARLGHMADAPPAEAEADAPSADADEA